MWRTPATLAGSLDDVPNPGPVTGPMTILALETSCDDTCAAVVDARRTHPLERDLLAGGARALRRRRPRDRLAPPPRAGRTWSSSRRSTRAGATLDEVELVAATQGPGLVGALLVGLSTAKALAAATRAAVRARRPPPGARRRELPARRGAAVRAAVRVPDRERRAHAAGARRASTTASRCSAARSTTPPARRSTRAPGCSASAIPGGAALERLAADGDPEAFSFPGSPGERARGGRGARGKAFADSLDFSFAGVKTALLYTLRELGEDGRGASARPTSRPPTRRRSSESLAARAEQALGADRARAPGGRRRRRRQRRCCAGAWASSTRRCTCPRARCAPTTPR